MSPIMARLQNAWVLPRQQLLITFFVLSVVSFAQYFPSLGNDFIWDGTETFLNDPSIRDVKYFSSYFTSGVSSQVEKQGVAFDNLAYFRPLIKVLHFVEYQAFGQNPLGYHAVSVILNTLVVLLAFLVVREIAADALVAFVAALFFAVNPSHVEAVSWAYSDSYLVFSLFCLLSLFLFLRRKLVLSLAAYACALLAQESAVLLPVIMVLVRIFFSDNKLGEKISRHNFYPVIPFFILAIGFVVLRSLAVGGLPITGYGFLPWLNAVTTIVATSAKIFFLPDAAIALYYNKPGMFVGASLNQLFIYLVVVCLGLVAVWMWRKHRQWMFWYLWFFVWLAVMFNVGEFAQFYFMDKILYLGSLGFCVLLAKGLLSWRNQSNAAIILITVFVVTHFSISMWREAYYANEKVYFEKAVDFAPAFPLLRYSAGMMYQTRGDYRRAEEEFKTTIKLDDGFSYAHNNLGNILYMQSDFAGAIASWQRALVADPSNPQPYYNIAATFERQGNVRQALSYYRQYLSKQPNPPADLAARIRRLQGVAQ